MSPASRADRRLSSLSYGVVSCRREAALGRKLNFELLEARSLLSIAPIGYWKFDGNGSDASGNGASATLANGAAYSSSVPAALGAGSSLALDGINDYAAALVRPSATSFSVSFWLRTAAINRGAFVVARGNLGAGGNDRNVYFIGNSINAELSTLGGSHETLSVSGQAFNDNQWHHVVVTFSDQVPLGQRLYVDGLLRAVGSQTQSNLLDPDRVFFGYAPRALLDYFQGQIDDASVWNAPLSQAQVTALYSGVSPLALGSLDLGDPPIAFPNEYLAVSGLPLSIGVDEGLVHDDFDWRGATLAPVLATPPQHGDVELAADGTFTYLSDSTFVGIDEFQYIADNGSQQSGPARVQLTVIHGTADHTVTDRLDLPLGDPNSNRVIREVYEILPSGSLYYAYAPTLELAGSGGVFNFGTLQFDSVLKLREQSFLHNYPGSVASTLNDVEVESIVVNAGRWLLASEGSQNGSLHVRAGGAVTNSASIEGGSLTDIHGLVRQLAGGSLSSNDLIVESTGQFIGVGALQGTLINRGRVTAGRGAMGLAIDGSFQQRDDAALTFDVAGSQSGSQYGMLAVSGRAALAGKIVLNLIDGFAPAAGDEFTLVTAGILTADVANLELEVSGGQFYASYEIDVQGNSLIVRFDDDPGETHLIPLAPLVQTSQRFGHADYGQQQDGVIGAAGDVDRFVLPLDLGQALSVDVAGRGGLVPAVEVRAPDGGLRGSAGGNEARVVVNDVAIDQPGNWIIGVAGVAGSTGPYRVRVVLNGTIDRDGASGSNSTAAAAINLESSFIPLAGGRGQSAVVVALPPGQPANRVVLYAADMSVDPGWALEGGWEYGVPDGSWSGDPFSGFTGPTVMGYRLSGQGSTNPISGTEYATTPTFDTRGYRDLRLSFYRALGENLTGDHVNVDVEVGNNGTTLGIWQDEQNVQLLNEPIHDSTWQYREYELPPAAAGNAAVSVRWGEGPAAATTRFGWNLDDVLVTGVPVRAANDWYRFSLDDGQAASFALAAAAARVELYDSQLQLLMAAETGPADPAVVNEFLDLTTNGASDDYYLHVSGLVPDGFQLTVVRDAALQTGTNRSWSTAQEVVPARPVLGQLGSVESGVYQLDDGHEERSTRNTVAGDILWLNTFDAQPGQELITSISLAWSSWVDAGRPASVLLYDDPNEDGDPTDAVLLSSAETLVTSPGTGLFTQVAIEPTFMHEKFFVAGLFRNQQLYDSVAPQDSTQPQNKSWTVLHSTPGALNVQQLTANSTPPVAQTVGNYLLRANWRALEPGESWYRFAVAEGDTLAVETFTPAGGLLEPANALDPALELYDSSGAIVAANASGAADGRNARLIYQATSAGTYRLRVKRENDSAGVYVLRIDGSSVSNLPPTIVSSSPANGQSLHDPPAIYRVDLSEALAVASVTAADLLVNGVPATAVSQPSPTSLLFTVDPLVGSAEGAYVVDLPGGAVSDVIGMGNTAYQASFRVDRTGPRVVESGIPVDGIVEAGMVTVELRFDEPLDPVSFTDAAVRLAGQLEGHVTAGQLHYDPATLRLSIRFTNLPDDRYTLTLDSGPVGLRDLAGNALDGGDFVLPFVADVEQAPLAAPPRALTPLGSLAYEAQAAGVLGSGDAADSWELPLAGGQVLSVHALNGGLALGLEIIDPHGSVLATSPFSPAAVIQSVTIVQPGIHLVRALDPSQSAGSYALRMLVGAAVEAELLDGSDNGTIGSSQDLESGFALLAGGQARRGAVVAQLTSDDIDFYRVVLDDGQAIGLALDAPDSDNVQLQLLTPNGQIVATGAVAGNADQVIGRYVHESGTASAGTYFVRVTGGPATEYNLLVLKDATFDIEGNNRPTQAQDLGSGGVVVGHIALPDGTVASPTPPSFPGSASAPAASSLSPSAPVHSDARFVPGELLVKFRPEVSRERRASFLAEWGGRQRQELTLIDALVVELVDPDVDIPSAARAWSARAEVLYAEPSYIAGGTDALPQDALFNRLNGLFNTGQIGGTADADIDAPEAWEVTTGSHRVVVADIDTGVDYFHPDLAANMWVNPGEIPRDGVDNDGNGYVDDIHGIGTVGVDPRPLDSFSGHGTHTAGTIGAVGNNGVGVTGVNWSVQIMALRGIEDQIEFPALIEAISYMTMMKTQYGVNVVACNNSYGGSAYSQALRDAISAATDAGIVFVASAGNSNANTDITPHYPSSYDLPGIISVAATDKNDTIDSVQQFTNYGPTTVDLGAPGTTILSTLLNGTYGFLTGTSMAAPHVTGSVALLRGLDPGASVADVKDAILSSVDLLPALEGKTVTGGRLNLAKAVSRFADDYYRISVEAGQVIRLETRTPDGFMAVGQNELDTAIELFGPDGQLLASDESSGEGNHALLFHTADVTGEYVVRVYGASAGTSGEYLLRADVGASAAVVDRHIFYNNSAWDGNGAGPGALDDAAIAVDKHPLLPGSTATLANYTSYSKGINGLMIDVAGLAVAPTAADFAFKVGNSNNVASWTTLATAPAISVRFGMGAGGSDRITLIWPDGLIQKQWLQVAVLGTSSIPLAATDVFYFGNAIGEAGNSATDAQVNAGDELAARGNPRNLANPAPIDFKFDYNRDRMVNAADQLISRGNPTNLATALRLIAPTASAGAPGEAGLADAAALGSLADDGLLDLLAGPGLKHRRTL